MKTKIFVFAIAMMIAIASIASPVSEIVPIRKVSAIIQATPTAAFSFLRSHRQGAGVTVTWGMTTEQGLTGFLVQRTYEDPNDPYAFWEDLCSMPCNVSHSYKHTDENVFPGFITYRVLAFLEFGGSMMSENITEHIH